MNPLLIASYKLSQVSPRPLRILFAKSKRDDFDELYIRNMFSPWTSWAHVIGIVSFENLTKAIELNFIDTPRSRVTSVLVLLDSNDQAELGDITHLATSKGVVVITSDFPEFGTLDNDFCREVAHHDFEIGGKNEWDGKLTKYSHYMLRLLSKTHSKDSFPLHVYQELLAIQHQTQAFPLEALDLGCGPLSWLRWGVTQGLLRVTGIDPLLEVYETVLARHGLDLIPHLLPSERHSVRFEEFDHKSVSAKFHLVYTNNALDHTQDPPTVMTQLATVLSPQGIAVVQVATNEGTRQNWDQLHKYDIYYANNVINCRNQSGDTQTLVSSETPLRLHKIISETDESLIFSAIRHPNLPLDRTPQILAHSITPQPKSQQIEHEASKAMLESTSVVSADETKLQARLRQVQAQNQQLQRKLQQSEQTHCALVQAKERIAAMESSKFWQVRTQWIKLKNRLGLPE
ncbi:MAG: class I SAM-dependent methyltransferase [Pegethrix bostrychoides GSE-TBD4-15B]|jgi:2-polyprenyl-3-methyl-5-hydroxy-6-metoxy-1,4-benzoquinol methylase|uniref:Class I SAM-dependent methyltransferase n=1 Tax=Pegethrix bostrychoides GSE-TBD4-15B TaxID=2839662 RepID=A0A951P7L5_9CYAN|nr:class I SAM-dependent methyltransferase [Pegethrix bostrychoides GSE-TBD4-15B]